MLMQIQCNTSIRHGMLLFVQMMQLSLLSAVFLAFQMEKSNLFVINIAVTTLSLNLPLQMTQLLLLWAAFHSMEIIP